MNLPELPKKIKKKEQDITPKILKWFKENYTHSCAIEIKISNTDTFSKSKLEEHQLKALLEVNSGPFIHKIADSKRRNPFDSFFLYKEDAWIVIYFTKYKKCLAMRPSTFLRTSQIRHTDTSELPINLHFHNN